MAEMVNILLDEDFIEKRVKLAKNAKSVLPPEIHDGRFWDLYLLDVLAYNRNHSVQIEKDLTIDDFNDERFKKYIELYW